MIPGGRLSQRFKYVFRKVFLASGRVNPRTTTQHPGIEFLPNFIDQRIAAFYREPE